MSPCATYERSVYLETLEFLKCVYSGKGIEKQEAKYYSIWLYCISIHVLQIFTLFSLTDSMLGLKDLALL